MSRNAYIKCKPSGVEWLGKIPEHWEARRLKYVARFGYGDSLAAEDRISGDFDVYGSNGIVGQHDTPNAKGPSLIVGRKGSFGKVAYSEKPCFAIDTTYFIDARLTQNNLRWLFYCLQWLRLDSFSKDSAVPGLAREDAYENVVPFCSPDEQFAIAAFLDRETVRIDALIEKKQKQIELFQEKRTALISLTVTKGLDPNVKMKDSGVEWLGEIPGHWRVLQIKRLSLVKRGASPRPIDDPKYFDEEGEYSWVRIADVTSSDRYLEVTSQRLSPLGKSLSVPLEPGAIFLSIAGSVGKPIITKIKCCIHDGFVYFPRFRGNTEFLYYIFVSGQLYGGLGKLGTQLNLNTDTVGSIHIGYPAEDEQSQIVAFLDYETARIDVLNQKVQESIDKLREYRTALISAAVTGKIDVRQETA